MIIEFCVKCFASSENSSGGGEALKRYCTNCGSTHTISIDAQDVDEIRNNASWVGKRYYPDEEDIVIQQELEILRPLLPDHVTDKFSIEIDSRTGDTYAKLTRHGENNTLHTMSFDIPRTNSLNEVIGVYHKLRRKMTISYEYRKELTK